MNAINMLIIFILSHTYLTHNSYAHTYDVALQNSANKVCLPVTDFLRLASAKPGRQPQINAFRAESSQFPIVYDDNGLTVIPDHKTIQLRLFGSNLNNGHKFMSVGFTTVEPNRNDKCVPDIIFPIKSVINDNIALVDVQLSETIADKSYFVCFGSTIEGKLTDNASLKGFGRALLLVRAKTMQKFKYISSEECLKVRVIGRAIINSANTTLSNRDAVIKSKLAMIVDEANKIHRIADEMQEWK